jgi:hypothetical protein
MKNMGTINIIIDTRKYKATSVCWKFRIAFSLLEVQIAMIVLTMALLGLSVTLKTHSRQMEAAELWCRENTEYYIVGQSNTWMRQFEMPAELYTDPNIVSWEPLVSGELNYKIELESFELDSENRIALANVKLKKLK